MLPGMLSAAELSDNSDDYDSSCSGFRIKENINKIFISANNSSRRKPKRKLSSTKSKETEDEDKISDASTASEIEHKGKVKTLRDLLANISNKKHKKRKREEVLSDDSTGQHTMSSSQADDIDKGRPSKKLKKKEIDKISASHESHETVVISRNINKEKNANIEQDNVSESASSSLHENIRHVSLLDIKRELLSDYGELESEAEVERNNSASENKSVNIPILKTEQQSQCSSDSEDESEVSTATSSHKQSVAENSSVTILQDIRLTPKSQTVQERLKEYFGDLKEKEITAVFNPSEWEEVSILRVPKNANINLKYEKIDPDNRCKLNLGEKYVLTPTTNIPDPNYIVSTTSRVIKFKNNIKMEKYFKSKSEPKILVPEKKSVPLPENLKKRHPLFGSDFKQKIRLCESVERKLDDAIANVLRREKKAKKKKNKKQTREDKKEEDNTNDDQEIFNLLNSHSFLTNNDRIKKETSDDSAFGSSSSVDKSRGKKKQKGQSFEQQIKQEIEFFTDDLNEHLPKKKKSKNRHDQDWSNISNIKTEARGVDTVDCSERPSSSKADKKKLSLVNSTLTGDIVKAPIFDPEVSTILKDASTPAKKSKKSKKERSNDEVKVKKEKIISELLNDITMEMKVPRIKKEN